MRTVFVFPTGTLAATTELLGRMMPGSDAYWTDEKLFVDLLKDSSHLFGGFEPEEIQLIDAALGYHPTWALAANVSGRIDGTAEVRAFVTKVDYSSHCWTLPEIEADTVVDGLRFFGFRVDHDCKNQP